MSTLTLPRRQTPSTAPRLSLAEHLGYLMATRPRLRRVTIVWLTLQILSLWTVAAAPPAWASTIASTLNWTGITDSHGVPLGAYYLSTVSATEAITEAGPGLSLEPSSWARWLANAVTTGMTHESVAEMLQAQAGFYIVMITVALWLLRFAMSSTWLYWLATWFRPLFDAFDKLIADLWLFPICLALAVAVGAYQILVHHRRGFGWGIVLSTFAIGIIGLVLTRDPLGELYSDDGLLNQGRNLGFTVAQGFINNGPITPGGNGAQMQNLTGLIADAIARAPLQLQNFGMVVDDVGSCGNAWSAAIMAGDGPGPAHAMANCGAPAALSFAQHLSGTNLATGLFFLCAGALFTLFVCYVAYSYVMVAGAAFLNAFLAVPAAATAMIYGRPRQLAWRRLRQFFKHAMLVFAYVTYICVAAVIVLKMASHGGYADQVGMTHPVARLILIALVSLVAIGLFRWLKHELGDHTRADLTRFVTNTVDRARSGYQRGQRGVERGRDLYGRARQRFGGNNDQDADDSSSPLTGQAVNGRPPEGKPPRNNTPKPHTGQQPQPATLTGPATGRTTGLSPGVAAGGEEAAAAGTAAEAGAAVVAPEIVIPAAAAAYATRSHRNGHNGSHQSGAHPNPQQQRDPNTGPGARPSHIDSGPPPQPSSGRSPTPTYYPSGPTRPNGAPTNAPTQPPPPSQPYDPGYDGFDGPTQGRSQP